MNTCTFSPCRRYRYTLEHVIDPLPLGEPRRVMWIGLNPSTADEGKLDPTLRRIRAFTTREGGTSFMMTNLFAFRATDPRDMKRENFPIGSENDDALLREAARASLIIGAWGGDGDHLGRDERVVALLRDYPIYCLGITKGGMPSHPLYLPAAAAIQRYA